MKLKNRRESGMVRDQRPPKRDTGPAPQDNTYVRNEGFGPIRDIVKRNETQNARLNFSVPGRGDNPAPDFENDAVRSSAERDAYEPVVKPTYEPIRDTKISLRRLTRPDVFARGRYKKSISARPPYKRNNNK